MIDGQAQRTARELHSDRLAGEATWAVHYLVRDHGYGPSVREIADALDIGVSAAWTRLQRAVRLGYLARPKGAQARGWRVVNLP